MYKTKLQFKGNEDMEIEILVKKKAHSSADQLEPATDSTHLLSIEETWQWLKDHYADECFDTLFGIETCIDEIPDTFEEVRQKISVYETERKEKKENTLYNGKVICLDAKSYYYTTGRIYQFKDGVFTDNAGAIVPTNKKIHSFEEWAEWSNAEWMEVIE